MDFSDAVVAGDGLGRTETAAASSSDSGWRPSAPRERPPPSILILGLGNDILTDDAIGLQVVRRVSAALGADEPITVIETQEMGLSLLDFMAGYRDLVLVDAIQTGKAQPGYIHEIAGDALKLLPRISPHFLGVGEIIETGRQLGLTMPERVRIVAVEVEDPFTLGETMTPRLEAAAPRAAARVLATARELAA